MVQAYVYILVVNSAKFCYLSCQNVFKIILPESAQHYSIAQGFDQTINLEFAVDLFLVVASGVFWLLRGGFFGLRGLGV